MIFQNIITKGYEFLRVIKGEIENIINEKKDFLITFIIGSCLSGIKIILLLFFKEDKYEFKN